MNFIGDEIDLKAQFLTVKIKDLTYNGFRFPQWLQDEIDIYLAVFMCHAQRLSQWVGYRPVHL